MNIKVEYFLEAMKKANIDDDTINAVKDIHDAIYDDTDDEGDKDNDDDDTLEPGEDDEEDEPQGDDAAALTKLYNIMSILLSKSNGYQNYHWNAESLTLHELSESAYNLYRDTYDKIAEAIVATYNKDINPSVWGNVPSISNRNEFMESIESDYNKLSELRDSIEMYKMYGINSVLDSFFDELTTIKYKLIRFFESSDKVV